MAQYDLTAVVAQHLDRHLVFPLLEFLGSKGTYDAADIEAAKLQLIEKTNMVDYAVDIYQQLNQTDEVRAAGRRVQGCSGRRPSPCGGLAAAWRRRFWSGAGRQAGGTAAACWHCAWPA